MHKFCFWYDLQLGSFEMNNTCKKSGNLSLVISPPLDSGFKFNPSLRWENSFWFASGLKGTDGLVC